MHLEVSSEARREKFILEGENENESQVMLRGAFESSFLTDNGVQIIFVY